MVRNIFRITVLVSSLLICVTTHGQEGGKKSGVNITGNAFIESLIADNANKVADENRDLQIEERQDKVGGVIAASYSGSATELNAEYSGAKAYYRESTQSDDFIYFGRSSVFLGSNTSLAEIALDHNTVRLLNSPEADADLQSNITQQTVYSAKPSFKVRSQHTDSYKLTGLFTKTEYGNDQNLDTAFVTRNDTEQLGAEISWNHRFSNIRSFDLVASYSDVSYVDEEELDYQYMRAVATFRSETRNTNFSFKVGPNRIEPKNSPDSLSGIYYSISFGLDSFGNQFNIESSKELTSTSLVTGITDETEGVGVAGSSNGEDQVNLTTHNLNWTNEGICQRCDIGMGFSYQVNDYVSLNENDSTAIIGSIKFGYNINRVTGLSASYAYRDAEYKDGDEKDTTSINTQLSVNYELSNRLSVNTFIRYQDYNSSFRTYSGNYYGIRLTAKTL